MPNRSFFDDNINNIKESLDDLNAASGAPPLRSSQDFADEIKRSTLTRQREILGSHLSKQSGIHHTLNVTGAQNITAQRKLLSDYREQDRLLRERINLLEKEGRIDEANYRRENNQFPRRIRDIHREIRYEQQKSAIRTQAMRVHSEHVKRHLQDVREAQQQQRGTLFYAIASQPHQPAGAIRAYGERRMRAGATAAMEGAGAGEVLGHLGMGALGIAGGMGIALIGSKIIEGIKRSYQIMVANANLAILGAARGQSTEQFAHMLNHPATRGLAISPEEVPQLGSLLLGIAGQQQKGGFRNLLRGGIGLSRGFGMEAATGVQFMAAMARYANVGSSKGNVEEFSRQIAVSIGEGRLAGLQQETLHGIQELVQLTRHAVVSGPDAALFARLIGNISGLGVKNLRGADAARALAGINNVMSNPSTQPQQMLSVLAMDRTLNQIAVKYHGTPIGAAAIGATRNYAETMNLISEGIGLKVGGRSFGGRQERNYLSLINRFSGGNIEVASFLMRQLVPGIGYGTAKTLLENMSTITAAGPSGFSSVFGSNNISGTPAGLAFYARLAENFKRGPKTAAGERADIASAFTTMAPAFASAGLTKQAERILHSGATPSHMMASFTSLLDKLKLPTPEERLKNAFTNLDRAIVNLTTKITKDLLPPVISIANFLAKMVNWLTATPSKTIPRLGYISNTPANGSDLGYHVLTPATRHITAQGAASLLAHDQYFQGIARAEGNPHGRLLRQNGGFYTLGFENLSSRIGGHGETGGLYGWLAAISQSGRGGHLGKYKSLVGKTLLGYRYLSHGASGMTAAELNNISDLRSAANPGAYFQEHYIGANKAAFENLARMNLPVSEAMLIKNDINPVNDRLRKLGISPFHNKLLSVFLAEAANYSPAILSKHDKVWSMLAHHGTFSTPLASVQAAARVLAHEHAKSEIPSWMDFYRSSYATVDNGTAPNFNIYVQVDKDGRAVVSTNMPHGRVAVTSSAMGRTYKTNPYGNAGMPPTVLYEGFGF